MISPAMLRDPVGSCPRRIARELDPDPATRANRSSRPYNRARVEDALWAALAAAHRTPNVFDATPLVPPHTLFAEEQALLRHAFAWYRALFAGDAVTVDPTACPPRTDLPRRGVALFGTVGLAGVDASGIPFLRRLRLGGLPDEPAHDAWLRTALLRLRPWLGDRRLQIQSVDLVEGVREDTWFDAATEIEPLRAWFDAALDALRARADEAIATPGVACTGCRYLARCPAHPGATNGLSARGGLAPGVIVLQASAVDVWRSCPRRFRNRQLLHLPASNVDVGPETGNLTHRLLELVHRADTEPDAASVERVLQETGVNSPHIESMLHAHLARRPREAAPVGFERTLVRTSGRPAPPFLAAARLDALWEHDGLLDVRDYKTGRVWYPNVAEDPQARVQAWVAAPEADRRGVQVRVRYEHLALDADEEPEPFAPEADDLDAIEHELRTIATEIRTADAVGDYPAASDPEVCIRCEFRAICPESATPADPVWPTPPG